jgi:hypothetical protein
VKLEPNGVVAELAARYVHGNCDSSRILSISFRASFRAQIPTILIWIFIYEPSGYGNIIEPS